MPSVKWNSNYMHCPACGTICHKSEYDKAMRVTNGDETRALRSTIAELRAELAEARRSTTAPTKTPLKR